MNSTFVFLSKLDQQGIKLWRDGDQLRVNAPQGVLTRALVSQLKERKAEILAFLSPNQAHQSNAKTNLTVKPIQPVSRSEPLPLSFAQQRLWFLDQLGSNEAYNIPFGWRLHGTLNLVALERALSEIIHRHESLRTTFIAVNGEARQVIQEEVGFHLPVVDLQYLPETARQAQIEQLWAQNARRPFDLTCDLMLRATLVGFSADEHLLLLAMHHIASDGWSMQILKREMVTLYEAFCQGKQSPLSALPVQYADFAQWQREALQGPTVTRLLAYWKKQLANAPQLLELPTDRPRPLVQSTRGAKVSFKVNPALTNALRQLSEQAGATLFMTLLAAFKILLSRYTGQEDIVVDSPIAGRNRVEVEPLIGFFVNTLLLRTDLSGNPSFLDLLAQVRLVIQQAYAHQELPFEQLVEALQPERTLSHNPLSQVSFAFQNAAPPEAPSTLQISLLLLEAHTARADMELFMVEDADGLHANCVYNCDLFDASTIERMMGHYQSLLTGIVATPHTSIRELPLLSEAERHKILIESNNLVIPSGFTQANDPFGQCIHQLFEQQVTRTPEAIAVVAGSEQLTYHDLNQRANQLAHHLQTLGVGPDTLVAICVERGIRMMTGLLAVHKAGGAYIPLDPAYPKERLRFMLEDAQPKVLLTEESLRQALELTSAANDALTIVDLETDWSFIAATQPTTNPTSHSRPENMAYVIYTSGSTGTPKGVMISHRALVNHATAMISEFALTTRDRVLQFAAFSFDVAAEEIFPTWLSGASVVLRSMGALISISDLLHFVTKQEITVLNLPASYWHEWVLQLAQNPVPECVRLVIVGSEKALKTRLEQWLAQVGQDVAWRNAYGLSEATITSTLYDPKSGQPFDPSTGSGHRKLRAALGTTDAVPIGRPIANTQLYLLDRAGQPVPIGVPGELYIGGHGLASGYLNRPQLTQARFVDISSLKLGRDVLDQLHRLTSPNHKLYKTGDLARYLPDGTIEFLGRADEQVKIRGFRIELGEIEAVLRQHPAVQQVVIVDRTENSGHKQLVAYVVCMEQLEAEREREQSDHIVAFRSHLQERLPDYMIPSAFVLLDALPYLPNGKVDRRGLPAPTAMPSFDAPMPRNQVEEQIAAVWRDVLQLENVGIHDNFFDLGGHSLLLLRLHHQLQEQLGCELAIVDLFQYPTISALGSYLSQNGQNRTQATPIVQKEQANVEAGQRQQDVIAIVGLSGRFPGARTIDEFWQNLRDGVESLTTLSDEELLEAGVDPSLVHHPDYVKARGILPDIDLFDAAFFGYSPREAAATDPQHRLFMECAWEALEDAGYAPEQYGGRIGVYAGAGFNSYRANNLANSDMSRGLGEYQIVVSNSNDAMPTRLSYKLNLTGPSVSVNTACSTALVAVHMASQSLLSGECDIALAGGVTVHAEQKEGYLYQEGMIMSPDGRCRAFDANAQGTAAGNGLGIVVLKPLKEAQNDGDHIYAVIKGSAINNDGGQKVGYTAPSVQGQAAVIRQAQRLAGVEADTISYIEAHGTGTPLGDPIEIAALRRAFGQSTQEKGFCAIGSVKTNVGHLDTAAGVAGLIKSALALQHKLLPPSLHFTTPNPQIDFANSPFYVNTELKEWKSNGTPRRAGVSSFGIGGTNAHLILEEAPPRPTPAEAEENSAGNLTKPGHLLLLSAKSPSALDTATSQMAAYLREHPDYNLADVAYTLSLGRSAFSHRRMFVCRDVSEAVHVLSTQESPPLLTNTVTEQTPRIVFMFSGQGSQYVGMGQELYQSEPIFREQVDHCSELLKPHLGFDLRTVLYPVDRQTDSVSTLQQTAVTQPALFVIEYALATLWEAWGVRPHAMIGHSIGEYVAATLAGVFTLEDALALVATRGRMMQELPAGAMLAIPLPEEDIRPLLGKQINLAVVNGPRRCVVAGTMAAISALERQLAREGTPCRRLHTSHAFHSYMMKPILDEFTARVQEIQLNPPQLPYLSNVTGTWITATQATDPTYWAQHLRRPVRFGQAIDLLLDSEGQIMLEVGPGRTLSTLVNRHPRKRAEQLVLTSLPHPRESGSDAAFALNTLGQLWLQGVKIDWSAFYAHELNYRVPLPTYPFERQRHWIAASVPKNQNGSKPELTIDTEPATSGKKADMADWFYIPAWKRAPLLDGGAQLPLGKTLIFGDTCGLAEGLARRLSQAGQQVVVVQAGEAFAKIDDRHYHLNPAAPADYDALFDELEALALLPNQACPEVRGIIHLWSVTPRPNPSDALANAEAAQTHGFYSLLYLAQALSKQTLPEAFQVTIISNNMQEVAGEAWLSPEKATLLGPVKVIPQEFAHITCQSVDVILPDSDWQATRLLDQLVRELSVPSSESVIAYRGHHRWKRIFEPAHLPSADVAAKQLDLRDRGIYLITGGLGGIGLALAEHLARRVQANLILTSRSVPARWEWADWLATHDEQERVSRQIRKIKALEALGANVMVAAADVTQFDQMEALIADATAQFGQIHGVIHAAGVPGGGLIQRKTYEEAARVLAPKVEGTLVLDRLLEESAVDWFVLCSSLTSITGGLGQIDYCAANAFQDAFAHQRTHRTGSLTVSINWDTWKEVGMAVDSIQSEGGATLTLGYHRQTPTEIRSQTLAPVSGQARHPLVEVQELGQGKKQIKKSALYLRRRSSTVAEGKRSATLGGTEVSHPLFDHSLVEQEGKVSYITRFTVDKHWVLNEHRVMGQATLPATAYLEMARAAFVDLMRNEDKNQDQNQDQAVELRDVFLLQPLVVSDEEEKEVHTLLQRAGSGWQFSIKSRTKGRWQEHARGEITTLESEEQEQEQTVPRTLADTGIKEGQHLHQGAQKEHVVSGYVEAGPRWQTFQAGELGSEAGIARFELSSNFAGDLAHYRLHPGLLDGATNFLTAHADATSGQRLPFSYQSLRIYRPLARTVYSQMRLAQGESAAHDETATFDITISDEQGRRLVEVEGYTLRKFMPERTNGDELSDEQRVSTGISTPPAIPALAHGLSSAEGAEVFERILAQSLQQVIVSTQDLATEIQRATSPPLTPPNSRGGTLNSPQHPQHWGSKEFPPLELGGVRGGLARPSSLSDYLAPRNELEQRIANVWEEFLGIEPVGIHDDFFALGGDSLLAIQLTTQLTNAVHQKVSANQLLNTPTVAALAADLAASATATERRPSLLVNLHRGSEQTRPLFLIHPVGGSIYHYRHLAQHLGEAQPVMAVQALGLEGEGKPLAQIKKMATHYLQLIQAVQAHGPYQLGGWSLGGLVAFEMAQQLRERGENVSLLVMIDSFFPTRPEEELTDAQYAAQFARYLGDTFAKAFPISEDDLSSLDAEGQAQHIVTTGRTLGILPPDLSIEQIRHRLAVYKANFRAMDRYAPHPYPGEILFFASSDSINGKAEATLGWAPMAAGPIQTHEIQGNHYSIIESPALIDTLRTYLEDFRF